MIRYVVLVSLLLAIVVGVGAQPNNKTNSGQKKNKVTGLVADEQGVAIPYASLALFDSKDSNLVSGTASDGEGKFALLVVPGSYYLKVSFLSYEDKVISDIKVEDTDIDLNVITLSPGALSLDEVVVEAEKSQMQLQLDKRVFNVGKDLSNTGSNAAEVLDNVPSVTVDVEGNVSLRGSENVRILIDGKPSGLTGISTTDALRQLPGDMIEKVEVITNPSARYDAEGEVGIINIVLKKDKRKGVNGAFNASAGYPHNHNGAFNLNFRRKAVNLFTSYGIGFRENPGSGYTLQNFITGDTTFTYERVRQHTRGGLSHNLRLGSDIFLNSFNTLTFSGMYRYSRGLNNALNTYKDYDDKVLVRKNTRDDNEEEIKNNLEGAISYRRTFRQKGRLWTVDGKLIESQDMELSDIIEKSSEDVPDLLQRVSNTEDENNKLFQTDYIHPFGKDGKVEGGYKGSFRNIENDYMVEEQGSDKSWTALDAYTNHFIYVENIHAMYLMAGNKFNKFSMQGGLRWEYSDVTTELVDSKEVNRREYYNFFPSAHVSYELDSVNTIQLSYSRRLSRPRFRHLLPFFSFSDNRNFYSGNPDLNPEFTDSYEAGYLNFSEKGSFLSSIYYRYRTGVIERITATDSTGFTRMFPVNLSTQNAFGLEFNFGYELLKWLNINGNANFYRAITNGSYLGKELYSDTYTWTSRLSTQARIRKKVDVQLSLDYRAPYESTQGRYKAMYHIDAGISREVFKGKGTLALSARDLFNTRKRRWITDIDGYYAESEFQWRSRQVIVSLNYRLNQKPSRRNKGDHPGGDDMEF